MIGAPLVFFAIRTRFATCKSDGEIETSGEGLHAIHMQTYSPQGVSAAVPPCLLAAWRRWMCDRVWWQCTIPGNNYTLRRLSFCVFASLCVVFELDGMLKAVAGATTWSWAWMLRGGSRSSASRLKYGLRTGGCNSGVFSPLGTVTQFEQHCFWVIEISAKDICKHSLVWMCWLLAARGVSCAVAVRWPGN